MTDIIQRMLKNIRLEAKLIVRYPDYTPPTRFGDLLDIRILYIEEEKKLYDAEIAAERANKIRSLRDKLAMEFGEEWEEWAKSLYVDMDGKIISTARDWKFEKSWYYNDELEKLQKIEQLIRYKVYDRRRGHGSVDEDLQKTR